jgi:hypothetical protein
VVALKAYNGHLFAGGDFTAAGGISAPYLARWNGSSWSAPGAAPNASVLSLGTDGTDLILTGSFSTAGGSGAGNVAYWRSDAPVAITTQPQAEITCPTGPVWFSVTASGPVQSYQWQRETAPGSNTFINLVDGPSPSGGSAQLGGAATQTLVVIGSPRFNAIDAVKYRCVLTGPCGSVTSAPAQLTVCLADFNCDQFVDALDYDQFIGSWLIGEILADVNADEFVDAIDYDAFISAWLAGC